MKLLLLCFIFVATPALAEPIQEAKNILGYMKAVDPQRSIYSESIWQAADSLQVQVSAVENTQPMPGGFIESQIAILRAELPAAPSESP
ncbi:MAG: hypothetical protein CL759_09160 [Chloroflexi bacterium]|nr:hypothetical protein [Chloroflexota bacterium]|tara:strand:- start:1356 stop:1622 length:267 start_codon:yes stop_codon:yes gene_type:complete